MTSEIKILCPARKCGKCRRMITRAEEAVKLTDQDISILMLFETAFPQQLIENK